MSEKSNLLKVGDPAPDFELPDRTGKKARLKDFKGKKIVVLYFYPRDFTPVCTVEACTFRDSYESFKDVGAEVVGVSSDPPHKHKRFIDENRLPFILLSDEDSEVKQKYGVSSSFGLIPGRVTFIIDKTGIIQHIFKSQFKPKKHVDEALKILRKLR